MTGSLPSLARRGGQARSPKERLWLRGGAFAAFILLLVGYFFLISPQRSDTSSLKSQVSGAQQQNAVLQARIEALRQQNTNLAKYQAQYAQARLALPASSGVSDFLRSLQSLGNATLTDVESLTVGTPTNVTPSGPQSSAPGAAPSTGASSPTPAPTTQTATPGNGTGVSTGASGAIFALPITADVTGSPAALGKFLDQLQRVQPRAVLITQVTEQAATSAAAGRTASGSIGLTLTMQAFVAPANPNESAALAQAAGQ